MNAVLAWVLKQLLNPRMAAVLAFAATASLAGVQTLRLHHAKADLAIARAALIDPATRQSWRVEAAADARNLTLLTAALDRQQASVKTLEAASATDTAAAQSAVQTSQTQAAASRVEAARVLASKPAGDACAAADALILGSLP